MLPNVEAQALPPIAELTAEALGLDGEHAARLSSAQALDLPQWRRTDLGNFDLARMRPVFGITEIEPAPAEYPLPAGVYVADLHTALAERPEIVHKYFGTAVPSDFNKFTALNAALARDGIVVHVPRNMEVAAPVRVRYRLPEAGVAVFPRTLVITHYQRLLNYIKPDYVHILMDGQIVRDGGPELALELDEKGYALIREEVFGNAS